MDFDEEERVALNVTISNLIAAILECHQQGTLQLEIIAQMLGDDHARASSLLANAQSREDEVPRLLRQALEAMFKCNQGR
jgi:hypothetical protein